ncbi:hypothetical protein AGMMS49949_08080 [Alphaproteobacteria bacterium]|nr:hypothetical protein AGMMS49949_08080 [Alphaproteobacteria bacterium]
MLAPIIFAFLSSSFPVPGMGEPTFSKEQVQEDLLYVVKFIEKHHFAAKDSLPKDVKDQYETEVAALKKRVR